jgi:hypothetical protein
MDLLNNPDNISKAGQVGASTDLHKKARKTLGEPRPRLANLKQFPHLLAMFMPAGLIRRLQRKLNRLSGEEYGVVPAEGDNSCIDEDGQVYVGVEFLDKKKSDEATIAGVLAHEWGHKPNLRPKNLDLDSLSWDEVHTLRRKEENKADAFAGEALFMMGYNPEGLISYLRESGNNSKSKTQKYLEPGDRARIILETYNREKRKKELMEKLNLFGKSPYGSPYDSRRVIDT